MKVGVSPVTTIGTATGAAGAALAITAIVIWVLSLVHIEVPSDVAVAFSTLVTFIVHILVQTGRLPKELDPAIDPVNAPAVVPPQTAQDAAPIANQGEH